MTKWFARFARREGLPAESLLEAIARADRGSIDADLGGGLIKQRVARPGKGRSGGYRTIIAYKARDRAFFLFGFAKKDLENIEDDQLNSIRLLGNRWLASNTDRIALGIREDEIQEITDGRKKENEQLN